MFKPDLPQWPQMIIADLNELIGSGSFTAAQLSGASTKLVNKLLRNLRAGRDIVHGVKKQSLLAIKQEWRCFWCNQLCKEYKKRPEYTNSPTIEHLIPRSQGGTDVAENLVMACWRCNQLRGSTHRENFATMARELPACSQSVVEYTLEKRRSPTNKYHSCQVVNIHRGIGSKSGVIYAQVVDVNGNLLLSDRLEHIMKVLYKKL